MPFETSITSNYLQGRFATAEEMQTKFPIVDYRKGNFITGGIPIISNGETAIIEDGDNSVSVFGSTGSKKSRDVVMATVLNNAYAGESQIIYDPKKEISKTLITKLEKLGYKIIFLDFKNPEQGDCYNPYERPAKLYKEGHINRATEMIKHFSDTIFLSVKSDRDPFWHLTSATYCSGLAELLCKFFPLEDVTIDNVYNLHFQGDEKLGTSSYMKTFFEDKKEENCWKMIYPVVCAPNETRSSLYSVFSSCLSAFLLNDSIKDMTCRSTFNIEDIVEEPTVVFITARDTGSVYDGLITAIIDQFYEILTDYAESHGGRLKRRVRFILDEFGNLTKINDIEKKISLSRARGILWMIVCQSLEQISLVYGDKIASIILGNCNDLVYLHTPDLDLIKRISQLCGETENRIAGKKVPLCPIETLRHFDKDTGECLILVDRMHPFITHLPDISEYYDIEPVDNILIPVRETNVHKELGFQKMVREIKEMKTKASIEEDERKHKEEVARFRKANEELRHKDNLNILSVLNEVISEMR